MPTASTNIATLATPPRGGAWESDPTLYVDVQQAISTLSPRHAELLSRLVAPINSNGHSSRAQMKVGTRDFNLAIASFGEAYSKQLVDADPIRPVRVAQYHKFISIVESLYRVRVLDRISLIEAYEGDQDSLSRVRLAGSVVKDLFVLPGDGAQYRGLVAKAALAAVPAFVPSSGRNILSRDGIGGLFASVTNAVLQGASISPRDGEHGWKSVALDSFEYRRALTIENFRGMTRFATSVAAEVALRKPELSKSIIWSSSLKELGLTGLVEGVMSAFAIGRAVNPNFSFVEPEEDFGGEMPTRPPNQASKSSISGALSQVTKYSALRVEIIQSVLEKCGIDTELVRPVVVECVERNSKTDNFLDKIDQVCNISDLEWPTVVTALTVARGAHSRNILHSESNMASHVARSVAINQSLAMGEHCGWSCIAGRVSYLSYMLRERKSLLYEVKSGRSISRDALELAKEMQYRRPVRDPVRKGDLDITVRVLKGALIAMPLVWKHREKLLDLLPGRVS